MIPIRLHLRNFLSYGENVEPLDFTPIHVACLSGNNGHGKSALLDAITWALWGEARTTSADDLVRLGQSSMQVEFDFGFDDHHYRVIRKRTRGRTGQSDLQFQVRNGDGSFRPLTEQGIRATQERIIQTLRMDYETFINSAFILQGRADEFARRGPTDRKKILAEILNLGVYDALVEAARRHAREAEGRHTAAEAALAKIDAELAHEPAYRTARAQAAAAAAEAQVALSAAQEELTRCLERKSDLEAKAARRDDLARRLGTARAEIVTLTQQRAEAEGRVAAAKQLLARREEIEARAAELAGARRDMEELHDRAVALARLTRERGELQTAIQSARATLAGDLERLRQEVRDLLAREEKLPVLVEEMRDLEQQARALDRIEIEQKERQEALQGLLVRQAERKQLIEQLETTLQEDEEKFALLKGASARCPVCEEALSPEKRRDLGWKLRQQRDEKQSQLDGARREAAELARSIPALKRELEERARRLKTGQAMRDRLAQAKQRHGEYEEALRDLPAARARAEQKEAQIRDETFAPEERGRLAELDATIAELGYDEEARRALQERVRALEPFEREAAALATAEAALPGDEANAAALAAMVVARAQAIAEDVSLHESLEAELQGLEAEQAAFARATAGRDAAADAWKKNAEALAIWDEKLARCDALREEGKTRRQERAGAERDQANHEELIRIFGKNGIQALIIENAVPEIENEANLLLARLTDNSMRVAFRTQRDLKNQSVAETLDIDISDQLGTRKLECFSGGESFRVHFAIRVALSKLLARRAGARLQTLVIDEGFGSQDTEGRERLVEAIHAVQEEFDKILVITHIDELKDAFPTRIEITKNHLGSQIAVY
jgi:exonuclease SbcC